MAEVAEILSAAGRLGSLVATHPAVAAYKEIIRQLELDVAAKQLLQQWQQLEEMLYAKQMQGQPIEVADKRQAEQLQQAIALNQTLKRFAAAEQEYMEFMKKVQETINQGMAGQLPPEVAGGAEGAPAAAPSKIILDT